MPGHPRSLQTAFAPNSVPYCIAPRDPTSVWPGFLLGQKLLNWLGAAVLPAHCASQISTHCQHVRVAWSNNCSRIRICFSVSLGARSMRRQHDRASVTTDIGARLQQASSMLPQGVRTRRAAEPRKVLATLQTHRQNTRAKDCFGNAQLASAQVGPACRGGKTWPPPHALR